MMHIQKGTFINWIKVTSGYLYDNIGHAVDFSELFYSEVII